MGEWSEIDKFRIKVKNQLKKTTRYKVETFTMGNKDYNNPIIQVSKGGKVLVDIEFSSINVKTLRRGEWSIIMDAGFNIPIKDVVKVFPKNTDPKKIAEFISNRLENYAKYRK